MNAFINNLKVEFSSHSNKLKAAQMKSYLRDQFEFFGINAPERKKICKDIINQHSEIDWQEAKNIAKTLMNLPQREFHYSSIQLMEKYKKQWDESLINMITYYTEHNAWWDTIDYATSRLLELYYKVHGPQLDVLNKWNQSQNIWQVRVSIIWQLHLKELTQADLLAASIIPHLESKEFFIQKAIGWSLRAYAKTNPEWVTHFVDSYPLPALSRREALKHLV